jgi:hypothetical protein
MIYTIRPISDRTPFTGKHTESNFRVTYTQAITLLDRELSMLRARNAVIELDLRESDMRLAGKLRAAARATSPAVRVAFDSKHGPLTYATDRFVRGPAKRWYRSQMVPVMADDWQHNLYAIAIGLEALRTVDRYGISRHGEQYAGWKQLPAGSSAAASHMTRDQALWTIGIDPADGAARDVREALRAARARHHPDRNNGDRARWDQVEQAARVLGIAS